MKNILFTLALLVSFSSFGQQLKAILMLGDEDLISNKQDDIEYMEEIRIFLQKNNVLVKTFYNNFRWQDVVKEAEDTSVFIYQGHGIDWKEKGYGGFDLKKKVSSEDISRDLKLKSNSIILFQSVCGGAGSSAGDNLDIGLKEAKNRIVSYSAPFFKTGAEAYFSINTVGGVMDFLQEFFLNKSIRQIFNNSIGAFYDKEIEEEFAMDKYIGIASRDWGGTVTRTSWINGKKTTEEVPSVKSYSIAYVSNPNYSIHNLTN
tara:strand:+ start:45 stop:824 length:780 start_codon:yes stop_codon:yes gene_type:complete